MKERKKIVYKPAAKTINIEERIETILLEELENVLKEASWRDPKAGEFRGERDILGRASSSNSARWDDQAGVTAGQFTDYQLAQAKKLGMHPRNIPAEPSKEPHRAGTPVTAHDKNRAAAASLGRHADASSQFARKKGMQTSMGRHAAKAAEAAVLTPVEKRAIADIQDDELIGAFNRLNKPGHPERNSLGSKFKAEIERRQPSAEEYKFAKGQMDDRSDQIINNFIRSTSGGASLEEADIEEHGSYTRDGRPTDRGYDEFDIHGKPIQQSGKGGSMGYKQQPAVNAEYERRRQADIERGRRNFKAAAKAEREAGRKNRK